MSSAPYNQQMPDGSWQYVTQDPDGTYHTSPIAPSNYGPAGITPPTQNGQSPWVYGDPNAQSQQQSQAQLAYQYASLAAQKAYQDALLKQGDEKMALDAAVAAAQNTLSALGQISQLRGPRNAFQELAMETGLNSAGYSNAIGALSSQYHLPAAWGDQFKPQGVSPGTIAEDMSQTGPAGQNPLDQILAKLFGNLGISPQQAPSPGGTQAPPAGPMGTQATPRPPVFGTQSSPESGFAPAPSPGVPQLGDGGATPMMPRFGPATPPPQPGLNNGTFIPTAAQQQAMLAKLPAPNQIDIRNWGNMSPDTQQFLLGAYEQKGYSGGDVQNAISRAAPQFAAPKFGSFVG